MQRLPDDLGKRGSRISLMACPACQMVVAGMASNWRALYVPRTLLKLLVLPLGGAVAYVVREEASLRSVLLLVVTFFATAWLATCLV